MGLSQRVARLERQAAYPTERLNEATERADGASDTAQVVGGSERERFLWEAKREGAREENLGNMLRSVFTNLHALSQKPEHPDRWLDGRPGGQFAEALAASIKLGREPALARQVQGTAGPEAAAVEQRPATPDAGLDFC